MIAFITGATSGIGRATAYALADKNFDLVLCGRRLDKLDSLRRELISKVKVCTLTFDIRNQHEVERSIQALPSDFQEIDILINNAGNAHGLAPLDQGSIADWDTMIDGNVKGLLYVSKMLIPRMIQRQKGHIVNISSIAGKSTYANGTVYCASKKAVEALSEGMRLELTQHGIKVTNIAPGAVDTEFSLIRFKGDKAKANKVYDGFEPLKAEDIADAIVYAVTAPSHVTIADLTIYPSAQASPTQIHRNIQNL